MKYRHILWLLLFALLAFFLQATSQFHFFYIEQLQLFQFTGDYMADKLRNPGGFSLLIGQFMTQFFIVPYAGPVIASALLTAISAATQALIKQISPRKELFLLSLLPAFFLLLIEYDFNYLLQGSVAYLLALLCLNGVVRLSRFRMRLWVALVTVPLLFWAGGPIAALFIFCLSVCEVGHGRRNGLLMAATTMGAFLLIAFGCVYTTTITDVRFAFLPDAYYHPSLTTPAVLYFSWVCLPFCLIGAFLYPAKVGASPRGRWVERGIQTVVVVAIVCYSLPRYNDQKSYLLKTLDYYARTAQWDELIRHCQGPISNYLYLTYLNRALTEKGELADRLFAFDQHGPQGLLVAWNKTPSASTLLSDVYFTIGEIALSQEMAFEAYVTVIGSGNPRNLQRLVQTNLIFGSYPIAEKYIRILENTFAYRAWAKRHRAFLNNDKAVEQDPLLGAKRKGLVKQSNLAGIDGLEADLLSRAEQNPQDKRPILFTGVSQLLAKNLQGFRVLIEKYYGTPVLPSLPVSFQEAVILLAERDTDYWDRFDLSESVVRRFSAYKKLVIQNRTNPQLPQLIQRTFGDTYWGYYMLK